MKTLQGEKSGRDSDNTPLVQPPSAPHVSRAARECRRADGSISASIGLKVMIVNLPKTEDTKQQAPAKAEPVVNTRGYSGRGAVAAMETIKTLEKGPTQA